MGNDISRYDKQIQEKNKHIEYIDKRNKTLVTQQKQLEIKNSALVVEINKFQQIMTKLSKTNKQLKQETIQLNSSLDEILLQIQEAGLEIERLQQDNMVLNNYKTQLLSQVDELSNQSIKNINNEKIKQIVQEILANRENNSVLIPDSLEQDLYEKIIEAFIKSI